MPERLPSSPMDLILPFPNTKPGLVPKKQKKKCPEKRPPQPLPSQSRWRGSGVAPPLQKSAFLCPVPLEASDPFFFLRPRTGYHDISQRPSSLLALNPLGAPGTRTPLNLKTRPAHLSNRRLCKIPRLHKGFPQALPTASSNAVE